MTGRFDSGPPDKRDFPVGGREAHEAQDGTLAGSDTTLVFHSAMGTQLASRLDLWIGDNDIRVNKIITSQVFFSTLVHY